MTLQRRTIAGPDGARDLSSRVLAVRARSLERRAAGRAALLFGDVLHRQLRATLYRRCT